ncbi:MAG TPA: HlyD family efflux transporter periplasmic adaptor subunit [Geobacteraceae bacterium]|nr:HlyD family efflux transporter periplasmic adaptor subunit [Geobacteraceae bacterium]
MSCTDHHRSSHLLCFILFAALVFLFSGCGKPETGLLQGYVEGEFVYIASPLPGTVTLQVSRGSMVKRGDPLFALESVAEMSSRDEAGRRLAQARAALEDARKGLRPTELESLVAQLRQAKAALVLAETELGRQERLFRSGTISAQDLDRARSARDQQQQLAARIKADLQTARLGARSDQVLAAQANVRALEAVLARAEWELSQKSRLAPEDALVYDTLYRSGEWVAAGRPVVSLLPAGNVKVRFFAPERVVASLHPGDPLTVTVDGVKEPFHGKISFISPKAEYTPPVIYSRESRAKLVFMVEATFPPESSSRLHPGQPVDVRLGR